MSRTSRTNAKAKRSAVLRACTSVEIFPIAEALERRLLLSGLTKIVDAASGPASGQDTNVATDAGGAVGPNNLLVATNSVLQWFDKATGSAQYTGTVANLFSGVSGTFYDARALYDSAADRFIVVALNGGHIRGAITNSSTLVNPANGGWHRFDINATATVAGSFADYPTIAVDAQAIYITANFFSNTTPDQTGVRLWAVEKDASSSIDATVITNPVDPFNGGGFKQVIPAQLYGSADTGINTYLVSFWASKNAADSIGLNAVHFHSSVRTGGVVTTPATVSADAVTKIKVGDVTNQYDFTVEVPQPGDPPVANAFDAGIQNAVLRSHKLYATNMVLPTAGVNKKQITAHWYVIDTSSKTLLRGGDVGGEDLGKGTFTIIPSIAADSAGNIGIGFSASGSALNPGAYFAEIPAGTKKLSSSKVLALGTAPYVRGDDIVWGDFSGTYIDPSNDSSFWVFDQYSTGSGHYGTRWGTFVAGADLKATLPALGQARQTPVHSLNITFSKAINPSTFTPADVFLASSANPSQNILPANATLTPVGTDNKTFTLGLSSGDLVGAANGDSVDYFLKLIPLSIQTSSNEYLSVPTSKSWHTGAPIIQITYGRLHATKTITLTTDKTVDLHGGTVLVATLTGDAGQALSLKDGTHTFPLGTVTAQKPKKSKTLNDTTAHPLSSKAANGSTTLNFGPRHTVTPRHGRTPPPADSPLAFIGSSGPDDDAPTTGLFGAIASDRLILYGTASPGSIISMYLTGTGDIGTVEADEDGDWIFDYTDVSLTPGVYGFQASTRDVLGDDGEDAYYTVIVANSSPGVAPSITNILANGQSPDFNRSVSQTSNYQFFGDAETAAHVALFRVQGGVETQIGSAYASSDDGSWEIDMSTLDSMPGDGAKDFVVQAIDGSGNRIGDESPLFRLVTDRDAPSIDEAQSVLTPSGGAIDSILLQFNEPIWASDGGNMRRLQLHDLSLSINGTATSWGDQTLEQQDQSTYAISNTAAIASAAGKYTLSLANGITIYDAAGNALALNGAPILESLFVKGDDNSQQIDLRESSQQGNIAVYINDPSAASAPAYEVSSQLYTQLLISGSGGNDSVKTYLSESLFPGNGINFDGGAGSDTATVTATGGIVAFSSGQFLFGASTTPNAQRWLSNADNVETTSLLSNGGSDQLTVWDGSLNIGVGSTRFGSGALLSIHGGTATLTADAGTTTASNLSVVVDDPSAVLSFGTSQHLYAVTNSAGTISASGKDLTLSGAFSQSGSTSSTTLAQLTGRDFTLSDGILTTTKTTIQNGTAAGNFTHTGGTHNAGDLVLGSTTTGTAVATYAMSNSAILNTTNTTIAQLGRGTFTQSAGTHTVSSAFLMGADSSSSNIGNYNLSGGILNSGTAIIATGAGSATFTQTGGTHNFTSLVVGNLASGTYTISGGLLKSITGTLQVRAGTVNHSGTGNVQVANLEVGADGGSGTYNLSGPSTATIWVSGNENILIDHPFTTAGSTRGTFNQTGGSNSLSGWIWIGDPTYGYGDALYNFSGGEVSGYGYNYASLNVSGGGTRTWVDAITNYDPGIIKVGNGTTFVVTAGITNAGGSYNTDPADNRLQSMTVMPTAIVTGGLGDRFFIDEDFISFSTQNEKWQTSEVELHFIGGRSHKMSVTGKDLGPQAKGFIDNFAWGRLVLGEKDSLTLLDGNDKRGGALYLNVLSLARGVAQIGDIDSNGLNIYYNPAAPANAYLLGKTYKLPGGGRLAPAMPPAPAPAQSSPGTMASADATSSSSSEMTMAKRKTPQWWELLDSRTAAVTAT